MKVGDRVKYTRCEYDHEYGWIGTIAKKGLDSNIDVAFDNGKYINTQEECVTLIEAESEEA